MICEKKYSLGVYRIYSGTTEPLLATDWQRSTASYLLCLCYIFVYIYWGNSCMQPPLAVTLVVDDPYPLHILTYQEYYIFLLLCVCKIATSYPLRQVFYTSWCPVVQWRVHYTVTWRRPFMYHIFVLECRTDGQTHSWSLTDTWVGLGEESRSFMQILYMQLVCPYNYDLYLCNTSCNGSGTGTCLV